MFQLLCSSRRIVAPLYAPKSVKTAAVTKSSVENQQLKLDQAFSMPKINSATMA
jgi:hypothetical protein